MDSQIYTISIRKNLSYLQNYFHETHTIFSSNINT